MIDNFVKSFIESEQDTKQWLALEHPPDYDALVKKVVQIVSLGEKDYPKIDPNRITRIDHGDYQGTLLFIIADESYQPSEFWYVKISYGSCSGCDTLQDINSGGYDKPNEQQIKDYYTLMLHIVQELKRLE